MSSTGRADLDLGTMENGGENEDDDGGQDRDSSGDLMGLEGRQGEQGTAQWILLPVWTVETHGKELRVDGDSVLPLWTVGAYGKVVPCVWKRKERKG